MQWFCGHFFKSTSHVENILTSLYVSTPRHGALTKDNRILISSTSIQFQQREDSSVIMPEKLIGTLRLLFYRSGRMSFLAFIIALAVL